MTDRRSFLKTAAAASAAAAATPLLGSCQTGKDKYGIALDSNIQSKLIVQKANAVPITGTFLDEISTDIPHQNWGEAEWDRDFQYMKKFGIDTVIIIRCGLRKWMTYPSPYLLKKGYYHPSVDLVDMFCRLAEKHGMSLYIGLYDSDEYWYTGVYNNEIEINKFIIDELWERYGNRVLYSFMSQYTPMREFPKLRELNRPTSAEEYEALLDYADELGLEDYFWQEGNAAQESFIPQWDGTGVLPE